MKNLTFILALYFCFSSYINAQKVCYFKMNMNDCDKCYVGLNNKKFVSKNIKIKYVFQKMYYDEKEEIVTKFQIDTLTESIIFNDSLYRELNRNNVSSTVHLYSNNQVLANFSMKKMDENFYLLNNPDTIQIKNLPKSFSYKLVKNRLYTFNRSKAEIVGYDLNEPDIKVFKFKITDQITKKCFNAYFEDTTRYNNFYDSLPLRNIPNFIRLRDILSFDVNNDTILILTNFLYDEYCIKKGIKDTCMFNFYSLLKIYNKNLTVTTVREKGQGTILSYDSKRLGILGFRLDAVQGKIFTNLTKKELDFDENDRYIAKLGETEDYLEDDRTIKIKMPKLNYKFPVFYISDYTMHYPFVFHSFSTELVNLESGKKIDLLINFGDLSYLNNVVPELGNPTQLKYKVIDFAINMDSIKVMFIREKKIFIQTFNLNSGKANKEKVFLQFEDNTLLRTEPKLQDYNTVILFPQMEDYFIRVKNY